MQQNAGTTFDTCIEVMRKILTKRVQRKADAIGFLGEEKYGFRKGRGTRDAIGALRTLTERSLQHGMEVYICFVDYEKAFDRVDWKKMINALRRIGVDWRDRRLIANLYLGQKVRVRIDGIDSEAGAVGRGVRQGCPLSPILFNIYIYIYIYILGWSLFWTFHIFLRGTIWICSI